ncbi:MAG: (2Fe-2S) ferredoxin domain-containing protein [Oligosphaeraceae bacterium]
MGKIKMVICIGSSCFARGNAENVKITEEFLARRGLSDEVDIDLSGGLCTGNCADGPIVIVNDKVYRHVENGVMRDILNQYFPAP